MHDKGLQVTRKRKLYW